MGGEHPAEEAGRAAKGSGLGRGMIMAGGDEAEGGPGTGPEPAKGETEGLGG